ncbi:PREDICTED: uncharacterized protein LOC106792609 [Polistes canadensis]|uniref:uncharacterized protein LOC106792609 n=1 Tax=Polistes canadensis TaxID=91411 RepID=UPI000718B418|nr:PREDICTED: uncharacterized protein LOC106792609 [Polistes canadensis]
MERGTTATKVKRQGCECWKNKFPAHHKKKPRDRCKRKRQTLVFNVNADDEIWHEPYMQPLQKEFSDVSILCDSKIELPWKDIALPTVVRKIRTDGKFKEHGGGRTEVEHDDESTAVSELEKKESTGIMTLPWHNLLITNVISSPRDYDPTSSDSRVKIPWEDLALDKPVDIRVPPPEEADSCEPDDLEIPWQDILIPRNIVIKSKTKIGNSSFVRRNNN